MTGAEETPLAHVVREIEAHAHEAGWDQPPQLYALVPTDELLAREPALAAQLGLDAGTAAGSLTPVQQEALPDARPLEETLREIIWPPECPATGTSTASCAFALTRGPWSKAPIWCRT
jgi:hypothetical protein